MLRARIAGVGSYLPKRVITSSELETRWDLPAGWIERVTGVRERRYATEETSAEMGAAAARQALEHAELEAREIDLIIGASIVPQQAIPCTATFVQRELGLSGASCPCFDINATCLSFLFALHTAAHFVDAGTFRNVLIFSSEVMNSGLNPETPESAVLFGDGAAAVLVSRSPENDPACLWDAQFSTDSQGAEWTQCVGGGSLHHPNHPANTPEMQMFAMNGPAVYKMALKRLPAFMDCFFQRIGWQRESVGTIVPHQASLHGVNLLTQRLRFRPQQVVSNLATRGNCGAASIPLLLSETAHSGRLQRGDRLILAGTGAGFSMGIVAMTF
jgi:3-oxoacyl-[acyl-carrier-protein] synthase-3